MTDLLLDRLLSALEHIAGEERPTHHSLCDCAPCVASDALAFAANAQGGVTEGGDGEAGSVSEANSTRPPSGDAPE